MGCSGVCGSKGVFLQRKPGLIHRYGELDGCKICYVNIITVMLR